MAHRVTRRVHRQQFYCLADFYNVTGFEADIHSRDLIAGFRMGDYFRAGNIDDTLVAANMVTVVVSIEYLGDLPAFFFCSTQASAIFQWVNGQRFAGLRAGDQIIEVTEIVFGPDLFDEHNGLQLNYG